MSESNSYRNSLSAQQSGNSAGVHFVMHELELGIMFCEMASSAGTADNAERSEARARRSLGSALHHVASLFLSTDERAEFNEKEWQVRGLLAALVRA